MPQSKGKVVEEIIDTTVAEGSVRLAGKATIAPPTLQKVLCSFYLPHNTDFQILVAKQMFEHNDVLAASLDFIIADKSYKISRIGDYKTFSRSILLLLMWRPCGSFAVRCYGLDCMRTSFEAICLLDRGRGYFSRKSEWRRGLVDLIQGLMESRSTSRYLILNPFQLTATVLLVHKSIPLQPALHSILTLLKRPSTTGSWV